MTVGIVPPRPGFNKFLSETCATHGALFVSDEVMTGFRVSASGRWGLDGAVEGWRPDLMTFGKVMGGGFPAAAFGGRADVMRMVAPSGPVYQAGTLSGNPLGMAAGLASLRVLSAPGTYERMDAMAHALADAARAAGARHGVPVQAAAVGGMWGFFLADRPVTDYAAAKTSDTARFGRLFHALLAHGVYVAPSAYEANFLSIAHDGETLERTVDSDVTGRFTQPAGKLVAGQHHVRHARHHPVEQFDREADGARRGAGLRDVDRDPAPRPARHLDGRAGQPCRAHVLDADQRVRPEDLEARLEQQLLGEWIPDLHRGSLALTVLVELRRGHRRAVDAVAPGLAPDVKDGVPDT